MLVHSYQAVPESSVGSLSAETSAEPAIEQSEQPQLVVENDPWFAVRVRSNYERVASVHLRERGYEEFSPSYKAEKTWSDRKKITERFLFPGYVFCRLNPQNRLPVLTVPGVVGLVSFGDRPVPIPDREIRQVRLMVHSGLLVMPWPFLQVGQVVLIERGPLTGVEGILENVKAKCRIVVSIQMLQRSVSTEIDRSWVRPLNRAAAAAAATSSPSVYVAPAKAEI
jgi:transcription termination/antitermination protein NusG